MGDASQTTSTIISVLETAKAIYDSQNPAKRETLVSFSPAISEQAKKTIAGLAVTAAVLVPMTLTMNVDKNDHPKDVTERQIRLKGLLIGLGTLSVVAGGIYLMEVSKFNGQDPVVKTREL